MRELEGELLGRGIRRGKGRGGERCRDGRGRRKTEGSQKRKGMRRASHKN